MQKAQKKLTQSLVDWYQIKGRKLPWRDSQDPYKIWISEVMLQQTTVQAVFPYYARFFQKFPDLQSLSQASLEEVYEVWSGLGYYSRAQNLHKAAKILFDLKSFPQNYLELLPLPGFGPYTSRAVSSIAFDQNVGVVDGNVIRILSRLFEISTPFWTTEGKKKFQEISDQLVKGFSARKVNQAFMDLGATLCTPTKPACFICPWNTNCGAYKNKTVESFPLKKEKKPLQLWQWKPVLNFKQNKLGFVENSQAPFLKNQILLPGEFLRIKMKPKNFDFVHTITKYKIFVTISTGNPQKINKKNLIWLPQLDWKKKSPTNLVQKVLQRIDL